MKGRFAIVCTLGKQRRGSGADDLSAAHSESIGGRSENWGLPLLVMAEFNVTYGWLPKI